MQRINIDLVETNNKEESNSINNVALKQSDAFIFFGLFFLFFLCRQPQVGKSFLHRGGRGQQGHCMKG